jgi:Cu(I)/Ag(I) efflux system membrane fusion protein
VTKLTQSNRKGLFIPIDAVIREENHKYIWLKSHGLFENVMVETGVEPMEWSKSHRKWIVQKNRCYAYAINSEYIFRKGSDPMAGMKCSNSYNIDYK